MKNKIILYLSFLILIIGAIYFVFGLTTFFQNKDIPDQNFNQKLPSEEITPTPTEAAQASESVKVTRVIDGDTIEVDLNGQKTKVRYIGIDTPETVDPRRAIGCFGKEASDANKSLVEGKEAVLVKDISNTDKFGRLLRYVYLEENGQTIFINDYLVRQGFAKVSTFPPDVKFTDQLLEAQKEAEVNKRGLWQKCQ